LMFDTRIREPYNAKIMAYAAMVMVALEFLTQMHFRDLHPSFPAWISALDAELSSLFDGEFSVLRDAGCTVVGSRGKRLRPAMLFLACACFGDVGARAVKTACLVELVHAASLVHDDVVDEADLRRGGLSARARWDNKFSVLLGDFILARIFDQATKNGEMDILRIIAPAAVDMGRGVILELTALDLTADEDVYWQVVHGKTASLFSAATRLGALIGGATADDERLLARVGECFGRAFQLADDLMDLQGTESDTGKPSHADWRQRKATLPLLYAVHHADPATVDKIHALWNEEQLTGGYFDHLRFLVESAGGFDFGWRTVNKYLAEACDCLHQIRENSGSSALLRLCTDRFPLPVLPSKS
ncbi:MAG TPA: polyprenyl synthetase family protein, partial [Armatimonadota bacterium]|nr:polyprenyl synthetase family protein [Armatimonadota bacterium]